MLKKIKYYIADYYIKNNDSDNAPYKFLGDIFTDISANKNPSVPIGNTDGF